MKSMYSFILLPYIYVLIYQLSKTTIQEHQRKWETKDCMTNLGSKENEVYLGSSTECMDTKTSIYRC